MFPSWTPQTMLGKSFTEDENPNSSQEKHSLSLFSHFPPPFLEDNDDFLINHLFSQQQFTTNLAQTEVSSVADSNKATAPTTPNPKPLAKKRSVNGSAKKSFPRKRTGKKDRHSKIYTAQGLRDRRMRLSVQIARKFFDLQDLLGFGKASETIDWLLSKSNAAIKELTADLPETNQICSASEKSSVSCAWENEEKVADNGDHKGFDEKHELKKSEKWRKAAAWDPLQVRKSREKARARARERTRKKMMIRNLEKLTTLSEENPRNLQLLQPSSALEIGEESGSRSQETNSSMGSERIAENVAIKTMNPSAGNVQEKYPCSIFRTSSNAAQKQQNPNLISMSISKSQKYCPNSIFMAAQNSPEQNPISIFISPSDIQEQNPTFITTSNVHLWSQYF